MEQQVAEQIKAKRKPRKSRAKPKHLHQKRGKPELIFTDDMMDEICERVSEGESLNQILKTSDHLPKRTRIYRELSENPVFADNYARACQDRAESQVDDIVALIPTITPANAHAIRAQIDALKWVAGKMKPAKYSDKVIHTGHDGGPLTLTWKTEADQDVIDITPVLTIPEN